MTASLPSLIFKIDPFLTDAIVPGFFSSVALGVVSAGASVAVGVAVGAAVVSAVTGSVFEGFSASVSSDFTGSSF